MKKWDLVTSEEIKIGWRKLLSQTFKTPDGTEQEFTLYHPGTSACLMIVTPDEKVVLARQFRPGPQEILDELPGGGREGSENLEEAARREAREETGYTGDLIYLGSSFADAYSTRIREHFLLLNAKKTHHQELDSGEFVEVILKSREDFVKQVMEGKLTDEGTAFRGIRYLGW